MTEIIFIVCMPIASLLIEWGKRHGIAWDTTLGVLSLVAGTIYMLYKMMLTPDMQAWVIAAYPVFVIGTTVFYKFARMIGDMREQRLLDEDKK